MVIAARCGGNATSILDLQGPQPTNFGGTQRGGRSSKEDESGPWPGREAMAMRAGSGQPETWLFGVGSLALCRYTGRDAGPAASYRATLVSDRIAGSFKHFQQVVGARSMRFGLLGSGAGRGLKCWNTHHSPSSGGRISKWASHRDRDASN